MQDHCELVGIKFVGWSDIEASCPKGPSLRVSFNQASDRLRKGDIALLVTALKRVDYGGKEIVWCMNSSCRSGLTEAALG